MEATSRNEALRKNLVRYRTTKPCKKGHFGERYTNTGACVKCISDYARKYTIARSKVTMGLEHIDIWLPKADAEQVQKLIKRLVLLRKLS